MPNPSFVAIRNGWPSIDIGSMRHPVTIQALGAGSPVTFDAAGAVTTWQTFAQVMAAIDPVRGTDVIRGGQITTQLYLTVAIWFCPGILASMRIVTDTGSVYVIQSVEDVLELHQVMLLNCIAFNANE